MHDRDDFITGIIILIFTFTFAIGIDYLSCKAQAEALGYKFSYGILKGCVLEMPNGKKVLLKQLREYGE